ncbi:hypothetical protein B0J15DRAFT_285418 [Fusarium solani]|uniref:Uncharacterized protein n=1 Tax=Fusarium solani TaxID=169388 RepID=A0A9P9HN72_FUSSL|nr:uncharacterized protein B0J15DRAFT_285418 [Fusarium solani]KAH7260446.1 hypothetical protein B0J15DRAFT_285418 [Fusarium solani]
MSLWLHQTQSFPSLASAASLVVLVVLVRHEAWPRASRTDQVFHRPVISASGTRGDLRALGRHSCRPIEQATRLDLNVWSVQFTTQITWCVHRRGVAWDDNSRIRFNKASESTPPRLLRGSQTGGMEMRRTLYCISIPSLPARSDIKYPQARESAEPSSIWTSRVRGGCAICAGDQG